MVKIAQDTKMHETLVKHFKDTLAGQNSLLSQKRSEAFASFEKQGFPTRKHEEWKYTDLKPVLVKDLSLSDGKVTREEVAQFLLQDTQANVLVFVNGKLDKALSTIVSPATHLEISDLSEANIQLVAEHLASNPAFPTDPYTTLNTAFAQHGAFIRVPEGKALEQPILLHFISDAKNADVMSQPRNLIILEENAQATVVESFHTIGSNDSFTNTFTEIVLGKESNVDYYKIQNDSDKSYHVGTTQIYHVKKSFSSSTTITLSGAIIRNNLNIELGDEYCEAYLNGLYLEQGNMHVDNHTLVDHAKPNCYSNELYKGVLDDKSSGVFNGKIYVKLDAQKTNAFQSNKNILLSPNASMNTKPQLEILADDVKCSHGCTVGQMDENALFFMRSRGIGEANAKALLTYAFASDVIEKVKLEPLRIHLNKLIAQRLGKGIITELV